MRRLVLGFALAALAASPRAERTALRTFTTADGLARDQVLRVVEDSRRFIWLGTAEGLSRHDGWTIATYGPADGLQGHAVHDLVETEDGERFVATDHGLYRLVERGNLDRATFEPVLGGERSRVSRLLHARDGVTWAGLEHAVARLVRTDDGLALERIELPWPGSGRTVNGLAEAPDGTLWVATDAGLFRRASDGFAHAPLDGLATQAARCLLFTPEGSAWAGLDAGLAVLHPGAATWRALGPEDGVPARPVTALSRGLDGTLRAATHAGLLELAPGAAAFTRRGAADGLPDDVLLDVLEDSAGNIWVATESGGAACFPRHGFVTFTEADGLGSARIGQLLEDDQGRVVAADAAGHLNVFDGRRFRAVRPNLSPRPARGPWGTNQAVLRDRSGGWWFATSSGVHRFPVVNRVEELAALAPVAVYTTRDGLPGDDVRHLFEDSAAGIWAAVATDTGGRVARFDRTAGRFVEQRPDPAREALEVTAFGEDGAGRVWLGLRDGSALRAGDPFATLRPDDGDSGPVRDIASDSKGRLWIARERAGLLRVDDPSSPSAVRTTPADGLPSFDVSCVVEGPDARAWIGTGRGVARLDPASGRIDLSTTVDGLASNIVTSAWRARDGALWFGTPLGVSRLAPLADRVAPPPPALIARALVGGRPWPVSDLGESTVSNVKVSAGSRRLEVEFVAPGLREDVRFQWKLEGADEDWCSPTTRRRVTFDGLDPGRYRLLVRALDGRDRAVERPAELAFRVQRPLWQRWWVALLALATLGAAGGAFFRWRVDRLIELERVRTRIASDLHDDIGAGLTQVAILSEVARAKSTNAPRAVTDALERIALVSRELVDSMSDIVWAVDPRRDALDDLVHRMRRFSSDVFTARDVAFTFEADVGAGDLRLLSDVRRQVFLIFKEAVNNAARHSACSRAKVRLSRRADPPALVMAVEDDGVGFELDDAITGLGLSSLIARARELGGSFDVESAEGRGTRVTLIVPLKRGR